jgi:hypothetical protein
MVACSRGAYRRFMVQTQNVYGQGHFHSVSDNVWFHVFFCLKVHVDGNDWRWFSVLHLVLSRSCGIT